MTSVSTATLKRFVALAAERLTGDWVVLGGAVLPLLGVDVRVTLDIDISGPETATNRETLVLMSIADELGLAVESINQAASFFLHRMPGWRDRVCVVRTGPKARILRPDATLFVLLKLERLSESDLIDCLAMLKFAEATKESVDADAILASIAAHQGASLLSERRGSRLAVVKKALQTLEPRRGVGK